MKLRKWLKMMDIIGCDVVIYDSFEREKEDDEEALIWEGSAWDVPYWITEFPIAKYGYEEGEPPIDFREKLGDKHNNRSGFIIWVDVD